jgi:hypothetical protein
VEQPVERLIAVALGWMFAGFILLPALIGPGLYLRWVWRQTGRRWAVVCGVLCVPPLAFLVTGILGGTAVAATGETTIGRGFLKCGAWGVAFSLVGLVLSALVFAAWRLLQPAGFGRWMRPLR